MYMTRRQIAAFDFCHSRSPKRLIALLCDCTRLLAIWLILKQRFEAIIKRMAQNDVHTTHRFQQPAPDTWQRLAGWSFCGRTNPYLFSAVCWTKGWRVWGSTAPACPASRPLPVGNRGEGSNTGTPPSSMGGRGGWKVGVECCFLFTVPALRGAISGCLLAGLQGRGETAWNTHTREWQWGISLHRREGGEGQDHHLTTGTATREMCWERMRSQMVCRI